MAWFNTTRFDSDVVSWQFDVFEWLFVNFGGFERFKRQALVTPTADFFPFNPTDDHSYATVVFETVKDYMGMDDWFCSSKKSDEGNAALLPSAAARSRGGPDSGSRVKQ